MIYALLKMFSHEMHTLEFIDFKVFFLRVSFPYKLKLKINSSLMLVNVHPVKRIQNI